MRWLIFLLLVGCSDAKKVVSSEAPNERRKIKIGVIDSGIDLAHPVFSGVDIEAIDCTGKGVKDVSGHGTAVVSRLVAGLGNHVDDASILVCKGIRGRSGYSSEVRCCFNRLAQRGVEFINYSGGSQKFNQLTQKGVDFANSKQVVVIKSSGNTGSTITHPCKGVRLIGASKRAADGSHTVASFSSYEPPQGCERVMGVVQGSRVKVARPGSRFEKSSGTSYSAPFATGLMASGPIRFIDLPGFRDGKGLIVRH